MPRIVRSHRADDDRQPRARLDEDLGDACDLRDMDARALRHHADERLVLDGLLQRRRRPDVTDAA